MNHPSNKRIRKRSTHFAVALTTVAFALIASSLMVSNGALAAIAPKQVKGYIWDSAGRPADGTDVTINILRQSDSSIRATMSETVGASGYYSVSFDPDEWDIGDTIQVIATYESAQQPPVSVVATSVPYQWANVTFLFEIPEFGSYLGLLLAGGAIGAVGIAVVAMKRRR
ncbi:MAG: hypothetical protein IH630_00905 [Thermoplasmata archaeon]|nr:hypothetical protein [Thermoplasmata archaeon]TFG70617.1 MAG: hypothetical protein E4H25_01595 [Methanomassiliicoccus sp.]